ncbi:MAG TPA: carbohydrate-binding protein [Solirubrobacteraceae bacterium]|jgi:chitinase|nr:carbohydrate-binding protein [Solirubrobacteraceae bacterium]
MVVIHEPQTKASNGNGAEPPIEPPSPELSPFRVAMLLIVLAGVAFGVWKLVLNSATMAEAKSHAVPVYAPYVDVTLTPTYQFQLPSDDPVSSAYLGFIVSDPSSPCTPSWGGAYTLAQADQTLELGARIAQLRKQGGTAMISFGGQANNELAVGCSNNAQLQRAYLAPIQRYDVNTIDFDIEGAALADAGANVRRADAVAAIQKQMAKHHRTLHVWMTLPVSSQGLTAQGVAAVRSMLAAHVDLAGVNVLAMDFGSGQGAAKNMFKTVRSSLYATHTQVQSLWRGAGLKSSPGVAWEHLGVTVMLGVNDITNERFTTSDAQQLAAFANRQGIPRVSAWSLNRDSECGAAFPTVGVVSNTCSGVLQRPLQFTKILSRLRGTKTARQQAANATSPALGTSTTADNPATSPYPIWQSAAAYVTGYKVVWQGDIYEANWWSQGTAPGSTATNSTTAGPWLLIGPVPAGSKGFKPKLLASAAQPAWSPTTVYRQGQQVSFDGLPYQARFYSKGDQPLDELPSNPSSPWAPLFTAPGEPTDTGIGSGAGR